MGTGLGANKGKSCFECDEVGHFNRDCPMLKNQEATIKEEHL